MITSRILSNFKSEGIFHAISGSQEGGMSFTNENFLTYRETFLQNAEISIKSLVTADQIHGSQITSVNEKDLGAGVFFQDTALPNTDGMITNKKGIFLAIQTADCVPIIGCDPKKQVVWAVHAGFRGAVQGIHLKLCAKLFSEFSCNPKDCYFFLGPSIQKESYVFESVFQYDAQIPDWLPHIEKYSNGLGINLSGYIKKGLEDLGVPERNIDISPIDTFKSPRFFSATKGDKERFWSVIGMRK